MQLGCRPDEGYLEEGNGHGSRNTVFPCKNLAFLLKCQVQLDTGIQYSDCYDKKFGNVFKIALTRANFVLANFNDLVRFLNALASLAFKWSQTE